MKIHLKIPATSANLGPGFDVLGLALKLYNQVEIEVVTSSRKNFFEIQGEGEASLPRDRTNIIYQALQRVFKRAKKKIPPLSIRLTNRIPLARGLGSSASAIIAGVVGANELLARKFSEAELLAEAIALEGHPDNVVPALVGGLCICYRGDELRMIPAGPPKRKIRNGLFQFYRRQQSFAENSARQKSEDDEQVKYLKISKLPSWKVVVCLPHYEVATARARKILPAKVLRTDAVFNLARVALLVNAFMSGDKNLLETAMEDRLHQPARLKLVPGMEEVFAAAWQAGALGVALSGSGPSIIAFAYDRSRTITIGQAMEKVFTQHKIETSLLSLEIDKEGTQVG